MGRILLDFIYLLIVILIDFDDSANRLYDVFCNIHPSDVVQGNVRHISLLLRHWQLRFLWTYQCLHRIDERTRVMNFVLTESLDWLRQTNSLGDILDKLSWMALESCSLYIFTIALLLSLEFKFSEH